MLDVAVLRDFHRLRQVELGVIVQVLVTDEQLTVLKLVGECAAELAAVVTLVAGILDTIAYAPVAAKRH